VPVAWVHQLAGAYEYHPAQLSGPALSDRYISTCTV
jgi:hypothetical protein